MTAVPAPPPAPAPEAATPVEALAADFDRAAASFEPDIARDGLPLDIGCRDTLHGCADRVREVLAPQWADLAARLAGAEEGWERWRKSAEKIADERDVLRKACIGFQEERDRLRLALEEIDGMWDATSDANDETAANMAITARDALGGAPDA